MKFNPSLPIALLAAGLLAIGCSSSEGDTSPLPQQSAQVRLQNAQKGIETSNMTPEQKQAADAYLRQGAEGAQRMKASANQAGLPTGG